MEAGDGAGCVVGGGVGAEDVEVGRGEGEG